MKDERKEKFTPGKWEIADASNGELWICANRSDVIASVYGNSGNVGNANARLIAAAPEMYAELKDLLDAMEKGLFPQPIPGCDYPAVMEKKHELRQLLKKARGEK